MKGNLFVTSFLVGALVLGPTVCLSEEPPHDHRDEHQARMIRELDQKVIGTTTGAYGISLTAQGFEYR